MCGSIPIIVVLLGNVQLFSFSSLKPLIHNKYLTSVTFRHMLLNLNSIIGFARDKIIKNLWLSVSFEIPLSRTFCGRLRLLATSARWSPAQRLLRALVFRGSLFSGAEPSLPLTPREIVKTGRGEHILTSPHSPVVVSSSETLQQFIEKSPPMVHCGRIGFHNQPTEYKMLCGLDPNLLNFATDQFEIKESSLGKNAGKGVFARADVPKGLLIMQEQAQHKMNFTRKTMDFIENI